MSSKKHTSGILNAAARDPFAGAPSFSLRHRLVRAAFGVTWLLLARWTPPQLRKWRNFLLRAFGADLHTSANVNSSARIWYPPNLTMRKQASLGPGVICYCMDKVTIGERAVVSQRAYLCAGTHDIDAPHFQLVTGPITIGARAWVATEAFVGPGAAIGEEAVLGARGVTVKDLEPWTVYAGNPARKVRMRGKNGEVSRQP